VEERNEALFLNLSFFGGLGWMTGACFTFKVSKNQGKITKWLAIDQFCLSVLNRNVWRVAYQVGEFLKIPHGLCNPLFIKTSKNHQLLIT
jgi:hypothetical protein